MPDTLATLDPALAAETTDPTADTAPEVTPEDLTDALVEEVSIDGMCGVY